MLIYWVLSCYSTAMSVTSGKSSWFIGFAYWNHMTSNGSLFFHKSSLASHPANMSHMSVSYIRSISTSTNVLVTFIFFPKLSLNLLSIGKLYQVSLEVHFTNNNYDAHDPQMGQLLGTSHNVGFLFEFSSLPAPSHLSSSTIDATISLDLWHFYLGHVSLSLVTLENKLICLLIKVSLSFCTIWSLFIMIFWIQLWFLMKGDPFFFFFSFFLWLLLPWLWNYLWGFSQLWPHNHKSLYIPSCEILGTSDLFQSLAHHSVFL